MQTKPHGKGLSGFIFGLLLATLIIGVVLYFLNNSLSGIKQPEAPKTSVQPEILTPRQEHRPDRPGDAVSASDDNRYTLPPGDITDQPPASPPTFASDAAASLPDTQQTEPTRPRSQPTQAREPRSRPAERTEVKPTPEQILNSGNVERAREQARRQRQEAEQRNGSRYIVQMGSYNTPEAADSQRAKLAILGINARISSSKSNGQTVYRIQSGRISHDEAQALSEKLRSNGIDSLTKQAD